MLANSDTGFQPVIPEKTRSQTGCKLVGLKAKRWN
jgi:hypothetical protein